MREIENLEAGMSAGLGATAFGIMGVASALGEAVGAAVRHRAYLQRVDALTRVAVRQNLAAARQRAAAQAAADEAQREATIKRINARLRLKAA